MAALQLSARDCFPRRQSTALRMHSNGHEAAAHKCVVGRLTAPRSQCFACANAHHLRYCSRCTRAAHTSQPGAPTPTIERASRVRLLERASSAPNALDRAENKSRVRTPGVYGAQRLAMAHASYCSVSDGERALPHNAMHGPSAPRSAKCKLQPLDLAGAQVFSRTIGGQPRTPYTEC